jgi:2-oxoglutarate ferredoxin oxidoreductase subunit beta
MKGTAGETFATTLNPCALVLASGGTFIARGYSGDVAGLTTLIEAGMAHQGFSFIEVLQHCPTYNKATPLARYEKSLYNVTERDSYSNTDLLQAFALMQETSPVATGILYKNPESQDFYSQQVYRSNFQTPVQEVKRRDVRGLLEKWII